MTMWRQLLKNDIDMLLQFLLPREACCTTLTAHYKNEITEALQFGDSPAFFRGPEGDGTISGVIVLYHRRQMFPVLDKDIGIPDRERTEVISLLKKNTDSIFSIMGTERDVTISECLFPKKPLALDYRMYKSIGRIREAENTAFDEIIIKKADKRQARHLFILQEGYEKEEVLLFPEKFNRTACMTHFKRQLSSQLVYYAEYRGRPVSKAGTNAKGYGYYQLGGIFTAREFRNAGIGGLLVHTLASDILKEGKEITLFVKRDNVPAIALYEKLGLVRHENYRIAYYL